MVKNKPILVLVGPTGIGKSAVGLELAERLKGEIICADSWTVRKYMNIGTAKPSYADQARVVHHLLDIVEPNEVFTAAVFKQLCDQAVESILQRGKLPIIVGGSGLYIDAYIYDYGFLEQGNATQRAVYNNQSIEQLVQIAEQQQLDLSSIDLNNKRRIIRALETGGLTPTRKTLRANANILGLTTTKDKLESKLISRVDGMLEEGLEHEVLTLSTKYGWQAEGLKGIGYREWQPYFDGTLTLAEVRIAILRNSRKLVKKQSTWYKRNKSIQWVDTSVPMDTLVALATTNLSNKDSNSDTILLQ